jgi:hypothetical protein
MTDDSTIEVTVPSGTGLAPPSGEELAAVVAAVDAVWPRPAEVAMDDDRTPAWRFSGRSWALPVTARRQRPWVD